MCLFFAYLKNMTCSFFHDINGVSLANGGDESWTIEDYERLGVLGLSVEIRDTRTRLD